MKLVTTTDFLSASFGIEKAVDMLADAGFDGVDFSSFSSEEFYTDAHPASYYTELRARAEARGLSFLQAHAPFNSSFADEARTEKRFHEIVVSMKNASLLGVENIVVDQLSEGENSLSLYSLFDLVLDELSRSCDTKAEACVLGNGY